MLPVEFQQNNLNINDINQYRNYFFSFNFYTPANHLVISSSQNINYNVNYLKKEGNLSSRVCQQK